MRHIGYGRLFEFEIKQGHHESKRVLKRCRTSELTFKGEFNSTAMYNLGDVDQYDINKLIGFKYGISPHENSARFGWRWNLEMDYVELFSYTYTGGVRQVYLLGYCFIGEIWEGTIIEKEDSYEYHYQGLVHIVPRIKSNKKKYYSFPYFGGNKKAPHNILIKLWL